MDDDKIMNVLLVVIIIAIVATVVIFYKPVEPHTKLYFTGPLNLKYNVTVNEPFNVNFMVENREFDFCDYTYVVSLTYQDPTIMKEIDRREGEISLNDNERATISEELVIDEYYADRVKVSVNLYKEGIDETYRSLRYWVNLRR